MKFPKFRFNGIYITEALTMWTLNKLECVDESIALKIIELIGKTTNYITQTLPKSHFGILYAWGGWHSLWEIFLSTIHSSLSKVSFTFSTIMNQNTFD